MTGKKTLCKRRDLKRFGFIVGCYPMGRGQGLLPVRDRAKVLCHAAAEGWKVDPLAGVGHDYNFDADLCVVWKERGKW